MTAGHSRNIVIRAWDFAPLRHAGPKLWSGKYDDPLHPGCARAIRKEKATQLKQLFSRQIPDMLHSPKIFKAS